MAVPPHIFTCLKLECVSPLVMGYFGAAVPDVSDNARDLRLMKYAVKPRSSQP